MIESPPAAARRQLGGELPLYLGLAAVVLFFAVSGFVAYWNTRTLNRNTELVTRTHEVLTALDDVVALATEAESSQRGYVISGDVRYLGPHSAAAGSVGERFQRLERLTADNPAQQERVAALRLAVGQKLQEMDRIIAVRKGQGFEPAKEAVLADRGKAAMEAIRARAAEVEQAERALRVRRVEEMEGAYRVAVASGVLTGLVGTALALSVALLVRRSVVARRRQDWLQRGLLRLAAAVAGDKPTDRLGDSVLKCLAEYLGAHAGAFFVRDGDGFRRVATYGAPAGSVPERFDPSDGLLGQAVKDAHPFVLNDLPEGYLAVGSALGRARPRRLVVLPAVLEQDVKAVVELGFLDAPPGDPAEFLERASEPVAKAVRSAEYRARLTALLEQTQRQAEQLQAQGEELRVTNEELEEQGRALRESQTRLELQQSELEAANSQLEEQTGLAEAQRDEANRTKAALQLKARELEQASRYKTDFLANMSHELRTPLNSSLILARLLADNREGNLTPEQVRYAETIQSAGNDLLALINDILDLSKIEAGRMELELSTFHLPTAISNAMTLIRERAQRHGIALGLEVDRRLGEFNADERKVKQILVNLLSNAVKFTPDGGRVDVSAKLDTTKVEIAVKDTGIGIAPEDQQKVFAEFVQVGRDYTRKAEGTGLGLALTKRFVELHGGEIHLDSAPGKGSTFTVTLPVRQ
jgi:signal transduction histidine kinase/CHASE3 domain sensor protein